MNPKNIIFITLGIVVVITATGAFGYAIFAADFAKKDTSSSTTDNSDTSSGQSTDGTDTGSQTPSATTPATPQPTQTAPSPAGSTPAPTGTTYRDGTYTAESEYPVPLDLTNSISVTLTVSKNKIIAVKTTSHFSDDESQDYIFKFNNAVSLDARSKDLATYAPSRIGGASLTTNAFADAVATIRGKAK